MIIYCAGPIKGDTTYQNYYEEIINFIEAQGHTALAELNSRFGQSVPLSDKQIYRRDIKWIDGSTIMIAEISGPSLGVGFEIAYALTKRKIPVLALVNKKVKSFSTMLSGCDSELLTIAKYDDEHELREIIRAYIKQQTPEK